MTDQEKLTQLQPHFAQLIIKLMDAVKARGHELQISEGFRSFVRQDTLYAQGRTKPGKIVTNAKAGDSPHNHGIAVDLCMKELVKGTYFPDPHPVWKIIGEEAEKLGLDWGGNWKGKLNDRPHVQVKIATAEMRQLHKDGGQDAVWAHVAALLQPKGEEQDKAA